MITINCFIILVTRYYNGLGRGPFPTMLIITRTVNLNITSYNESIINQTVEKLSDDLIATWKNIAKLCELSAAVCHLIHYALAHDIWYAYRARARIRVHPVGRSNELITILYTFEHNIMYVCVCV